MVYLHYTGQRKFYATGYIAIRNFFWQIRVRSFTWKRYVNAVYAVVAVVVTSRVRP